MKRSFFCLCLFALYFFVLPAVAQEAEYIITERELTRLETISQTWEKSKRNQQLQVQSLKARLTEALTKSEALSFLLQTERETLKSLKQSYAEYERELDIKIQEYETLIDMLNSKLYRTRLTLVILSCVLVVLILGSVGFFILKMKFFRG